MEGNPRDDGTSQGEANRGYRIEGDKHLAAKQWCYESVCGVAKCGTDYAESSREDGVGRSRRDANKGQNPMVNLGLNLSNTSAKNDGHRGYWWSKKLW